MRVGVFALACFAVLATAGAAPAAQQGPHASVAFWNLQRGLIGTGSAHCIGACGSGTVELTTDGGKTWKPVLKTEAAIVQLDTAGSGTAWAVSQHCPALDCTSRLWRTSNSGRSWSLVAHGLNAVSFATPRIGLGLFASTTQSKLFRSVNGGVGWNRIANPCGTVAPTPVSVSLVSPRHGFVVCNGQSSGGAESKVVYETTNGGSSWKRKVNAVPGSGKVTSLPVLGYVAAADFAAGGSGAICQVGGLFVVSRNAGRTWSPTGLVRPRVDSCSAVATIRGAMYAIVQTRFRDRLMLSTDGGHKWQVVKRF
jgi:photosystem II stability/assembly factor-like uncharacterized protein